MVADLKPDLPTLVVIGARCLVDETLEATRRAGAPEVRPLHGFLFAAIRTDGMTVGGLAERLEVSHQAAGKIVDEMESLGLVRRTTDPADTRRRLVTLTARARQVMEAGRQAREQIEAHLVTECGADDVAAAKRVLERVVGWSEGSIDALARRAKPVW